MNDCEKLEKLRVRRLNKLYGAVMFAIIPTAFMLSITLIEQKQLSVSTYCVSFFIYFFVLAYILFFFMGNQSFEHNIKQKVLPDLLKDIIQDKGELYVKKNILFNLDLDDIDDDSINFSMLPEVEKLNNCENYHIDGIEDIVDDLQEKFDEEIDNKSDELYEPYTLKCEALENEQSELLNSKENSAEIKERLDEIGDLLTKLEDEESPKIEAEIRQYKRDLMTKYIKELNDKLKECIEKQYQNDIEELKQLDNTTYNIEKLSGRHIARKKELEENIKNYNEIKKLGDIVKIKEISKEQIDEDKESLYDLKLSRELTQSEIFAKDTYYGTYFGSKFVVFDIKKMCILKLENKFTDNTKNVFVSLKNNANTKYAKIMSACLPCFDIENRLQKYFFKVYSKSKQDAEEIVSRKFIDLVNCLGKKYSYAFVKGDLYIIWTTPSSHLKLISLFNKVGDNNLLEKFTKDMQEILDIVEKVSNLTV